MSELDQHKDQQQWIFSAQRNAEFVDLSNGDVQLTNPSVELWVGTAGDIEVTMLNGQRLIIPRAFGRLVLRVRTIHAANTDADHIVAFSNFLGESANDGAAGAPSGGGGGQAVLDAALLAQFDSEFSRIKEKRFMDTEEVRYDIPASLVSGFLYVGVALDSTATNSAVWTIVRTSFDANENPTRDQIRFNVAWDDRAVGW